jgi:hypothetical protein
MELPTELWHLIGQANPGAYYVLVQCCKAMAQPMDQMIERFTRIQHITSVVNYKTYYLPNGYIHRSNDMPAIEYEDGTLVYMQMNLVHRNNDKPSIITKSAHVGINGRPAISSAAKDRLILDAKIWYKHGKIHRDNDLPAAINDQVSMWYQNNEKHRDGCLPAVTYMDGVRVWYIHGCHISRINDDR